MASCVREANMVAPVGGVLVINVRGFAQWQTSAERRWGRPSPPVTGWRRRSAGFIMHGVLAHRPLPSLQHSQKCP